MTVFGRDPDGGQQVDPPIGGTELRRHVAAGISVSDPVAAGGLGPVDDEAAAVVVSDLQADPAAGARQGPQQLTDQAFALTAADAADDGQPGGQWQGEGEVTGLEPQALGADERGFRGGRPG